MTMSPEVRAEYDRVLRAVVLRRGILVSEKPRSFGWMDADYVHTSRCVVTSDRTPDESEWSEFAGTFAESDATRRGIDVSGVSCACGELVDRVVRWEAGPSEMIEAVFEEAFGAVRATRIESEESR